MKPIDLSYILSNDFYSECEKKYRRALHLLGDQKRLFFDQCSGISLELIEKAFQSTNAYFSMTPEESEAISYLFWKIYFSENQNLGFF